jgi:hypothetical protein
LDRAVENAERVEHVESEIDRLVRRGSRRGTFPLESEDSPRRQWRIIPAVIPALSWKYSDAVPNFSQGRRRPGGWSSSGYPRKGKVPPFAGNDLTHSKNRLNPAAKS